MRNERRKAFSLVELLVVVAAMGVLLALTGLAVSSLGSSQKLTTAGNATVDLINQARQAARTYNTLTMLAMVKEGDEANRAFSLLAFSSTNGTNGIWRPLERWKALPDGIVVNQEASTNFFRIPPATAIPIDRAGQTVECLAAVFLPDGRTWTSSSQPQVILLNAANGPTNNFYKIIVNPATGVPMIRRP